MSLTASVVLAWAALFSALAVLLSATESWAIRHQYGPGGILATNVVQQIGETNLSTRRQRARSVTAPLGMSTLLVVEIVSATVLAFTSIVALLLTGHTAVEAVLWVSVVCASIANLAVGGRTPAGQDGADQMASIVLVACGIGLTPGLSPFVHDAAVWFIAVQACLAYATAGFAKVLSSDWRSGDAVRLVFRTSSYGNQWIREQMERYEFLPRALCVSVMAGECLFSVGIVLGGPFLLLALTWGLVFHISVVAIMRLNTFVLAFPATYAALYFVGS